MEVPALQPRCPQLLISLPRPPHLPPLPHPHSQPPLSRQRQALPSPYLTATSQPGDRCPAPTWAPCAVSPPSPRPTYGPWETTGRYTGTASSGAKCLQPE